MFVPILLVFLMGAATGVEISAQYPQVPTVVNEIQHTVPAN